MYDNYNYPPGADNPSAPWNEKEPPVRTFSAFISQTLSKQTEVTATYNEIKEWDDMGGFVEIDTSDTNWEEAYTESGHFTPLELITLFKNHLEMQLKEGNVSKNKSWYKHLIKECDEWVSDELIIEEG